MNLKICDVAAVLVGLQNRAAHCIERHGYARSILSMAELQGRNGVTPIASIDLGAARAEEQRWAATTRAVLDVYSRFLGEWNAAQQQFQAANDACAAEAVLTESSKPDILVKLLKLGALDKGAIYEITGWPMAAVEATIGYLLQACRITYANGNQTRTYCVVPA